MEDDNDNKILQDDSGDDDEYKYNFISIPWDDRTTRSKIGIISLLLIIIVATLGCVALNLISHFLTSRVGRSARNTEIKCHFVKVDEYRFVARIHSVQTHELLCVGAVISQTSVIANGVCVKAGPIRLRVGNPAEPQCKKGFSVNVVDPLRHEGTVSKHLVLLITYEKMAECVNVIPVGTTLDWNLPVYIIGRPMRGERSLSRQPAKLTRIQNTTRVVIKNVNVKSTICVTDLTRCPVRAGDLLLQNWQVFGLASTSTHVRERSKLACFADLRMLQQTLSSIK